MDTSRDWITNLFGSCCGIRRQEGVRHEPEFLLHNEPSVEQIQPRARFDPNQEPKQSKNELSVRDMDTIESIKNCMGQLSDGLGGTLDQDYAAISEALNALPDEVLRIIFINEILNDERRRYRRLSESRTQGNKELISKKKKKNDPPKIDINYINYIDYNNYYLLVFNIFKLMLKLEFQDCKFQNKISDLVQLFREIKNSI